MAEPIRHFFSKLQIDDLPVCRDEVGLVVCQQTVFFHWPDLGPSMIDSPTDPSRRQLRCHTSTRSAPIVGLPQPPQPVVVLTNQTRITRPVNHKHGLAEPLVQKMKGITATDNQLRIVVVPPRRTRKPFFPMDRVDIQRVAKLARWFLPRDRARHLYAEIAFPGGSSVLYGGLMHPNRAKCLYLAWTRLHLLGGSESA